MAAHAVSAPNGAILWYNSKAAEIWGRRPIIGDLDERYCGSYRLYRSDGTYMAHSDTPIVEALKSGAPLHEEDVIIERPDGSRVTVCVHIDAVRDEHGTILGVTNFFYDVTERKTRERDIKTQNDRLELAVQERTASLAELAYSLDQRNKEILAQSEQLRGLSAEILRAQDEERRRIAREMHDSAGQTLTALSIEQARIAKRLADQPDLAQVMEYAQTLAEQLTQEVRTTAYLLHPPTLDEGGVGNALRWYVDGLTSRNEINFVLQISEDFGRLPATAELAVFRIVQEALTNIRRHSGSKDAVIRIGRNDGTVSVEVEDHGNGMSPEKVIEIQERGGVGFRGMRERLRQLGGELSIKSGPTGTTIRAQIPIHTQSSVESAKVAYPGTTA